MSYDSTFFWSYYKNSFSPQMETKFFGDGLTNTISGILSLVSGVVVTYPTISGNIKAGKYQTVKLSWLYNGFTDSYNIYKQETSTSGYSGTLPFFANTDKNYLVFPTAYSGAENTIYVTYAVRPVHQGYIISGIYDTQNFSYTRT